MKSYSSPGVRAAVSVHHHPYTQGYVRKKLQNIGVKHEPAFITDRAEMIHTDRAHSIIGYPRVGPDHLALSVNVFSPGILTTPWCGTTWPWWTGRIGVRASEVSSEPNSKPAAITGTLATASTIAITLTPRDTIGGAGTWGVSFSGPVISAAAGGGTTTDFDRWCFWNEGFWWWQDPYHVGDLYCYNNDTYVPCNSAEDQVVVQSPDNASFQTYTSPDGTREVKVATDTQDAFLYDTANPPSFSPIYMASGVQSVQFSDTSNGRPLEIILKLNDGSFDMFDGQGNSYNPGSAEAEGAAPPADGSQPMAPPDGGTPPADSNAPAAAPGQSGT